MAEAGSESTQNTSVTPSSNTLDSTNTLISIDASVQLPLKLPLLIIRHGVPNFILYCSDMFLMGYIDGQNHAHTKFFRMGKLSPRTQTIPSGLHKINSCCMLLLLLHQSQSCFLLLLQKRLMKPGKKLAKLNANWS